MSITLFVFSPEPIGRDLFVKSLQTVGAKYNGIDEQSKEPKGQFRTSDMGSYIDISLSDDPTESISQEDKDVISKVGGLPKGAIVIEPLGGEDSGQLEISYLAALADEIDYVVTDFDDLCITGKEVQEKKKLGWVTLTPSAPGREFG